MGEEPLQAGLAACLSARRSRVPWCRRRDPASASTVPPPAAVRLGRRALAGNMNRPNGNGGRTIGTTYLPPLDDQR